MELTLSDHEHIKDDFSNVGAYIYQPNTTRKAQEGRPRKRRKVVGSNTRQNDASLPFVPLLNGKEHPNLVTLRHKTFRLLWSEHDERIQSVLGDIDSEVLEDVASFVNSASPKIGQIPAALVTSGPNVSSLARLLDGLNRRLRDEETGQIVILESGDAPNLKTALKNIIRIAITNLEGNEGYQGVLNGRAGSRQLPYDFNLLHDYLKRKGSRRLVIAFWDSESFDQGLFSDVVSLISCWVDRIPFILLFGIATSAELFEERLPRSAAALLQGQRFEIHDAGDSVGLVYESLQTSQSTKLWLGHHFSNFLFEKSRDYFHSPEGFIHQVKYAYMSHFFANSMSVLLSQDIPAILSSWPELCEAIRNLPSFRSLCEHLLQTGESERVRNLLEEDKFLLREATRIVKTSQDQMRGLFRTVKTMSDFQQILKISKNGNFSNLSVQALSGQLASSSTLKEIVTAVRRSDSETLQGLFPLLIEVSNCPGELQNLQEKLDEFFKLDSSAKPFQNKNDSRHLITKDAVLGRVDLGSSKRKLSEQGLHYRDIVDKFCAALEALFAKTLTRPQDLFFNEVFLFDFKQPTKDTFAPRARFAIERALFDPFDYLMCTTDEAGGNLSAGQPMTAILYQLSLESGWLVNIYDLWKAFHTILDSDRKETRDERLALALFYRALSELKGLGMVKSSHKKIDHIARSAWKGL